MKNFELTDAIQHALNGAVEGLSMGELNAMDGKDLFVAVRDAAKRFYPSVHDHAMLARSNDSLGKARVGFAEHMRAVGAKTAKKLTKTNN